MLVPAPACLAAKPGAETCCNLFHQVGLELSSVVPPPADAPPTSTANARHAKSAQLHLFNTSVPFLG
jgi:hypothetical protein